MLVFPNGFLLWSYRTEHITPVSYSYPLVSCSACMLVFPLCQNITLFFSLCPIGQHSNVRLVNVNNTGIGGQYEGRIEILHNGTWGTICDHDWEYEDAQVACRLLGFSGTVRAVTNAYYGRGSGRVWLDHVECTGSETNLTSCRHNNFESVDSDCRDHSNDAGVVCTDGECDFVLSVNIVMWRNVCNTRDTTPFPLLPTPHTSHSPPHSSHHHHRGHSSSGR